MKYSEKCAKFAIMKKIIVESHVPFVGDAFEGVAEVVYLPPEKITRQAVSDADALIVRTRTRCDASLLEGSKVKFVATATIGTDHLDLPYLASKGIEVVNAPGCNAPAVAQYVMASLLSLYAPVELREKTLGIVGVGHVGSIIDRWARSMGMKTLLCDPPLQEKLHEASGPGALREFHSLHQLAEEADIITFHTPLTKTGPYPTFHLADVAFFTSLARKPLIINTSRGAVVDNDALRNALDHHQAGGAVVDTWEGEPRVSLPLLERTAIATPHIAGYSLNGKRRATQVCVNAALRHFGSDRRVDLGAPMDIPDAVTPAALLSTYHPLADDALLRTSPERFEDLRSSYHLRVEPF